MGSREDINSPAATVQARHLTSPFAASLVVSSESCSLPAPPAPALHTGSVGRAPCVPCNLTIQSQTPLYPGFVILRHHCQLTLSAPTKKRTVQNTRPTVFRHWAPSGIALALKKRGSHEMSCTFYLPLISNTFPLQHREAGAARDAG